MTSDISDITQGPKHSENETEKPPVHTASGFHASGVHTNNGVHLTSTVTHHEEAQGVCYIKHGYLSCGSISIINLFLLPVIKTFMNTSDPGPES